MTKTGLPPRKYSSTRETPAVTNNSGIETEALNFNPETSTNSARSQTSKPPSSSRTKNSRPSFSPASKTTTNQSSALLKGAKQSPSSSTPNKTDIKSPSERVSASTRQRKSPGVRTVSSTSSAQSRTLTSSSRTNSSGSINTLTSQNKDPGSDAASDDEQDIRFFDVQSQSLQSSRASSKLSSRSARVSATQRKQEGGGKKPYKTIDPEEIVSIPYILMIFS